MKIALAFLLALALAACKHGGGTSEPPGNDGTGSGTSATGDAYACSVADDCVAVELECCDACNGGHAVAVNKDHVDEVTADSPRAQGKCGDTMCTEMACPPWVTTCASGRCEMARGQF